MAPACLRKILWSTAKRVVLRRRSLSRAFNGARLPVAPPMGREGFSAAP